MISFILVSIQIQPHERLNQSRRTDNAAAMAA